MISATTFLAVFFVVVFLVGCALGALVLLAISIHRAGYRTPIREIGSHKRGGVSRCVLITTRAGRKENGE